MKKIIKYDKDTHIVVDGSINYIADILRVLISVGAIGIVTKMMFRG